MKALKEGFKFILNPCLLNNVTKGHFLYHFMPWGKMSITDDEQSSSLIYSPLHFLLIMVKYSCSQTTNSKLLVTLVHKPEQWDTFQIGDTFLVHKDSVIHQGLTQCRVITPPRHPCCCWHRSVSEERQHRERVPLPCVNSPVGGSSHETNWQKTGTMRHGGVFWLTGTFSRPISLDTYIFIIESDCYHSVRRIMLKLCRWGKWCIGPKNQCRKCFRCFLKALLELESFFFRVRSWGWSITSQTIILEMHLIKAWPSGEKQCI